MIKVASRHVYENQNGSFAHALQFDDKGERLAIRMTRWRLGTASTFAIVDIASHVSTPLTKPLGAVTTVTFRPQGDQWLVAAQATDIASARTLGRNSPLAPGAVRAFGMPNETVESQEVFLELSRRSHERVFLSGAYPTRRPRALIAPLPVAERFLTPGGVLSDGGEVIHQFSKDQARAQFTEAIPISRRSASG